MEVVVIGVQANIVGKVAESGLVIKACAAVVDVFIDDVFIFISLLDSVEVAQFFVEKTLSHLEHVRLLNNVRAYEVERIDLIWRRENYALAVFAVSDSHSKGIDEHTLVKEAAHVAGSLDEGGEVLSIV